MPIADATTEASSGRVTAACAGTVATLAALESTAWAGWPSPMPSAWSLLAVAVATRVGGLTGGAWSAAIALAYATYTLGFTTGQAAGLAVWGKAGARVVAFGLASLLLVGLLDSLRRNRDDPTGDDAPPTDGASRPTPTRVESDCQTLRDVAQRSAHDLNNLLLVITASGDFMASTIRRESPDPDLAVISEAVDRCTAITTRLLEASVEAQPPLLGTRFS